jgi:predicted transcriptional regulator
LRLIEALIGTNSLSVRELSRRLKRDVKAVHTSAQVLVAAGLVSKFSNGNLSFPYGDVVVHFAIPPLPLQPVEAP